MVYGSLLFIGLTSTISRYLRYRMTNTPIPRLLRRDLVLLATHAVPYIIILTLRVMDKVHFDFGGGGINSIPEVWVLLFTPGIVGVAVYVYFELFVIEK